MSEYADIKHDYVLKVRVFDTEREGYQGVQIKEAGVLVYFVVRVVV